MPSPLHVVRQGSGPLVVLVHGSATDHQTWSIQLAGKLGERVRLVAYDRRGAGTSELPPGVPFFSVEEHAAELAELCERERNPDEQVLVVGSSFGAVVVLEMARTKRQWLDGIVLCEPPLPPSDDAPDVQGDFLKELDRLAETEGPPAAAERFLRTVLGDVAWGKLPRAFQERSKSFWPQIRGDCHALAQYRVRYGSLGAITTPALLLAGDRSAPYFAPTVEALTRSLGDAVAATIPGAGHMMQAEAPRGFHERLLKFAESIAHIPPPS
jgi:pimeloyl-ACP methyl ester carboxylesterase